MRLVRLGLHPWSRGMKSDPRAGQNETQRFECGEIVLHGVMQAGRPKTAAAVRTTLELRSIDTVAEMATCLLQLG